MPAMDSTPQLSPSSPWIKAPHALAGIRKAAADSFTWDGLRIILEVLGLISDRFHGGIDAEIEIDLAGELAHHRKNTLLA